MAQLPFELQKLPTSALEVLRYFGANGNEPADEMDIIDGASLSERSFSKAIKRLVTKKFAEMDAARNYKLTDKGTHLMEELLDYDRASGNTGAAAPESATPPAPVAQPPAEPVQRQLTVVLPEPFIANEPSVVYVGLDNGLPSGSTDLIFRVSCIHAEPASQDQATRLGASSTYAAFQVTAGEFTKLRVQVEAFQADEFSGSLDTVGGLYVDVDISAEPSASSSLAAFGTEVTLLP